MGFIPCLYNLYGQAYSLLSFTSHFPIFLMSDLDYSGDSNACRDSYHRGGGGSGHNSDSEGLASGPDDEQEAAKTPTLQFCSAHKPGMMVEVCKTCSTALALVGLRWPLPVLSPDMMLGLMRNLPVWFCPMASLSWLKILSLS